MEAYKAKTELMQLMKDMLKVSSGEQGNVLFDPSIDAKYKALNIKIERVSTLIVITYQYRHKHEYPKGIVL